MILSLPKGYVVPEGTKPGEPFEAVATLAMNEDGTFTLAAIDGSELEDEMEEDDMEEEAKSAATAGGLTEKMMPWNAEDYDD